MSQICRHCRWGNGPDGLIVSQARDGAAIHNLEATSFGPGCGIGRLIEKAPHVAVALRGPVAVVYTRALWELALRSRTLSRGMDAGQQVARALPETPDYKRLRRARYNIEALFRRAKPANQAAPSAIAKTMECRGAILPGSDSAKLKKAGRSPRPKTVASTDYDGRAIGKESSSRKYQV